MFAGERCEAFGLSLMGYSDFGFGRFLGYPLIRGLLELWLWVVLRGVLVAANFGWDVRGCHFGSAFGDR